jgi:hypothetical protein
MAKRAASHRKAKKTVAKRKTAKRKTVKRKSVRRTAPKRKKAKRAAVRRVTSRAAFDLTRPAEEEALKAELDAAITAFNTRRTQLLKKAFDEGGDAAVAALEQQHDTLRTAFFDLLKRQLDRNNAQYVELTTVATKETAALKSAIESLANVASILKLATSVVRLIGKVTTVLGV